MCPAATQAERAPLRTASSAAVNGGDAEQAICTPLVTEKCELDRFVATLPLPERGRGRPLIEFYEAATMCQRQQETGWHQRCRLASAENSRASRRLVQSLGEAASDAKSADGQRWNAYLLTLAAGMEMLTGIFAVLAWRVFQYLANSPDITRPCYRC